jgi:tetratricopeptide (TPR) repeat protein
MESTGDFRQAARYYYLAGKVAFATYSHEKALNYLNKALAFTPDSMMELRYDIMLAKEKIYSVMTKPAARSKNLTALAALADALDDDARRAEVAGQLVLFKLDNGEHQDAISIARLAVRIAQMAGNQRVEASLYNVWGLSLFRLDDYAAARSKFQTALEMAKAGDYIEIMADSFRFLGDVYEITGMYDDAQEMFSHALTLFERLNDKRGIANILNNFGKIEFDQGQLFSALDYWNRAKQVYLDIGDLVGNGRILVNISASCLDLGNYDLAKTYGEEALQTCQKINLKFGECLTLINLSLTHHYLGNQEQALALADLALSMAKDMESKRLEGYASFSRARALRANGRLDEAEQAFLQTFSIWHILNHPALMTEVNSCLAELRLQKGDKAGALAYVDTAVTQLLNGLSLEGTESAFNTYKNCYLTLAALQDSRAKELLQLAYKRLQESANSIADEDAKARFLQVEAHRQLIEAYQAIA